MVELVGEEQFEKVTVRGLSRLAGVSTGTFYKHFENVEDCFGSTYESLMQRALREAYREQQQAAGEGEGLRAALRSLLAYFAGHPKEARLVLVDAYAAGPEIRPRMHRSASALARILSADFDEPNDPWTGRCLGGGVAAGVTQVARSRSRAGECDRLPGLADQLGDWAVSQLRPAGDFALTEAGHSPSAWTGSETGSPYVTARGGADGERGRILAAIRKLSLTGGPSKLTLAEVCSQAGVSRRAFKAQFGGIGEAFLEAVGTIVTRAAARAHRAAVHGDGRPYTLGQAIRALCHDIACNPAIARLCFVELTTSGREGLFKRDHWVSVASDHIQSYVLDRERSAVVSVEASVASAWQIAEARIAAGRAHELPRLAPLLAHVVLAPRALPALSMA